MRRLQAIHEPAVPARRRSMLRADARETRARIRSQSIHRTLHAQRATIHHVEIHHRRPDVPMPEQFLDRANVVPVFEETASRTSDASCAGRGASWSQPTAQLAPPPSGSPTRASGTATVIRIADLGRSVVAGNTNCHRHSAGALGNLRSNANGKTTRPNPRAEIRLMEPPHLCEVPRQRLPRPPPAASSPDPFGPFLAAR